MNQIILLHGALGAASQLNGLKNMLELYFKVFVLEFKGHGRDPESDSPFSIQAMCQELDDFVESHSLRGAFVFGYSMGGFVALLHAANYPGKLKAIMSLATKFDWNLESANKEAHMLQPEKMQEMIPDYCKHLELIHGSKWKQVVRKTARMMQELGQDNVLDSAAFAKIRCPVLLCLGDKDKMVSLKESQETQAKIKNAELKILEHTAHPFERVDLNYLKDILLEFTNSSRVKNDV